MPSDNSHRKRLGASGERIARRYLEGLGWRMLAANFRCPQGEIDLIAEEPVEEGEILVFLEVKTRRSQTFGAPIEAVTAQKQKRLLAVAQAYLAARNAGGEEPACRFDVVEVWMGPEERARVALRRGVFGAGG